MVQTSASTSKRLLFAAKYDLCRQNNKRFQYTLSRIQPYALRPDRKPRRAFSRPRAVQSVSLTAFSRLRFGFLLPLLCYAEEFNILQLAEFLRRREENLCLRDAIHRLEVFLFLHRFRGERGAKCAQRTGIDDEALRTKLAQHLAKLVKHGSHVGIAAIRSQSFSNDTRCLWQTGLATNTSLPFNGPTLIFRLFKE